MKKILVGGLGILAFLSWIGPPRLAASQPPAIGETLPAITLPIPGNLSEKNYLGISGKGYFKIPEIRADVVIIEIFSLYCPICQSYSPEVNVLYRMIEQVPEFKGRIKVIGIGAGNSTLEVQTFKEKNDVPFPLFQDQDFAIHKRLGEVRTPYFIVIKINKDRTHKVIYSKLGDFGEAETFLQQILDASGLRPRN
jgi:peroxiredoxin